MVGPNLVDVVSIKNLQFSHVLNVLYPGTKKGNAYAGAYVLLTRTQVLRYADTCQKR